MNDGDTLLLQIEIKYLLIIMYNLKNDTIFTN